MMFDDLTPYQYGLSRPLSRVFSIGWLGGSQDYATGVLPAGFCSRFSAILVGNTGFDVHFNRVRCVYPCNLCGDREIVLSNGESEEMLGMSEVLIPSVEGDTYFASPSLLYHYIAAHGYCPPQTFINAVYNIDLSAAYSADDIFDGLLMS